MIFDGDVYTPVDGFPGYFVSKKLTQVISTKPGRNCRKGEIKILNPTVNSGGYYHYCLRSKSGNPKNVTKHRILASAFIPKVEGKTHVNHIDGNKKNNSLENLEWCTSKENTRHAHMTGLVPESSNSVSVHQYSLKGEYIRSFKKIRDAATELGLQPSNIVYCAKGKYQSCGGFIFSYELKENIPPYVGNPITKFIKIKNMETQEVFEYQTLAEAAEKTKIHRSKFLRRFKKSDAFYIENFHVEKIFL